MINLIKNTFKQIVENPSITLFFVLFLLLTNFLTTYILTSKMPLVALVLTGCMLFLIAVFIAGWFETIKTISKGEKKNLYSIFLEGIGKNIVSVIVAIFIYVVGFALFALLAKTFALLLFGKLDFLNNISIPQNSAEVMKFLNGLTINQQSAIYGWYFTFICSMAVFNFLILFYFPSMFFIEDKNIFLKPLIAVKDCLVFTFKNFFGVLLIYAFIHIVYIALMFLNAVFLKNALAAILILFLYIYFVSFSIMLIFNYYETKTNSNNRPDSIGEDETVNRISTQD